MKEINIKVKGMMCEGCENRIKNAVSTINGVESVEANHREGTVRVLSNETVKKENIEEKIDDIGFEVVKE